MQTKKHVGAFEGSDAFQANSIRAESSFGQPVASEPGKAEFSRIRIFDHVR
jgi:hypothetical protein